MLGTSTRTKKKVITSLIWLFFIIDEHRIVRISSTEKIATALTKTSKRSLKCSVHERTVIIRFNGFFLLLTAIYSQMRNFSQLSLRLYFENTIF